MSTRFQLRLPAQLYSDMIAQAQAELPNECCGLLAGTIVTVGTDRIGQVTARYPLVNAAASPKEYLSEPRSIFAATRDINTKGLEILAVYHSHPTTHPVPSDTDLERNYYGSDVMHLIISLAGPEPEVRGWWLMAETYVEAEVRIE